MEELEKLNIISQKISSKPNTWKWRSDPKKFGWGLKKKNRQCKKFGYSEGKECRKNDRRSLAYIKHKMLKGIPLEATDIQEGRFLGLSSEIEKYLIMSEKTYTEKALVAYQRPFTLRYGKILTANGHMVADFCANLSNENKQRIVDILNGESDKKTTSKLSYSEGHVYIEQYKMLLIRGWGHLTGIGGLKLPSEEAAKIQDALGEWIANTLQKHE